MAREGERALSNELETGKAEKSKETDGAGGRGRRRRRHPAIITGAGHVIAGEE